MVEPVNYGKTNDSLKTVSGVVVVFFYFGGLAFIFFRAVGNFELLDDITIGSCVGIFAVVSVYLLASLLERVKEFAARVFRAIAIGLLLSGFVALPLFSLGDQFSGSRRINLTGAFESMVYSHFAPEMMASALMGGSFAVVSFALCRNTCTALIIAIAFAFAIPYLTGKIPLFYR